jgi:hypothetical protein
VSMEHWAHGWSWRARACGRRVCRRGAPAYSLGYSGLRFSGVSLSAAPSLDPLVIFRGRRWRGDLGAAGVDVWRDGRQVFIQTSAVL